MLYYIISSVKEQCSNQGIIDIPLFDEQGQAIVEAKEFIAMLIAFTAAFKPKGAGDYAEPEAEKTIARMNKADLLIKTDCLALPKKASFVYDKFRKERLSKVTPAAPAEAVATSGDGACTVATRRPSGGPQPFKRAKATRVD